MADKNKLSASDVQLLLAQMAQALANTPGTMAGAQTAFEGAKNTAASEYQAKVEKEREKAKKGGTLGTLGQIGGMALGNTLLPGVGGVLGAGLGGVAGHAAAGEQIDPMAAAFNMGINAAAQYGLPKAQEAIGNVTNPGDWSRVDRTAQTSARQIRGPETPIPENAPLVPSPTPAPAPAPAPNPQSVQPQYQFGGTASAGAMPGQQVQGGQNWTNMVPPQGQYVEQPPSGGPGSTVMSGLQMNVNDQGLGQGLPVPGAQQAQAPQQDFVGRLATNIAQAIQQVGLPQMSVVTPHNPRVPRALDAATAAGIRNEGVQQDYMQAQLANQTAQTQATTANTQLAQQRFGYQKERDTTTDQIGTERFNTETGLAKDRINLEQQQIDNTAKAQAEANRLRAEEQAAQAAHMRVVEDQGYKQLEISNRIANKPSGGGADNSLARERFTLEKQQAMSLTGNPGVRAQFENAATVLNMTTYKPELDRNLLGKLYAAGAKYIADGKSMDEAVSLALQEVGGEVQHNTSNTMTPGGPELDANGKPIRKVDYTGNGSLVLK